MNTTIKLTGVFLLLLLLNGCSTIAKRAFLPTDTVRPVEFEVDFQDNVTTPMSDGTLLSAKVYRPRGLSSGPVILIRAPYSAGWKTALMADVLGEYWASRGYGVVLQSSRGRKPSGGAFYPLADEREDGIDTLRWLTAQEWCDGRIGMWGGSSFGYTQWAIADQDDPGVDAYMIQISSSETREMFYPGGAFALESALYWALRSYQDVDRIPSVDAIRRGVVANPITKADDLAAENIVFFDDWATHTEPDEYWRRIDGEDRASALRAPTLLMAGWFDPFLPAQLEDFKRIRARALPEAARHSRLIVGPWSHAAKVALPGAKNREDYRKAALEPSIAWFDTHLSGRSETAKTTAPVRLFVMGINEWRDENEWPLDRAEVVPLYLLENGKLGLRPMSGNDAFDTFTYDPNDPVPTAGGAVLGKRAGIQKQNGIEAREDVLVYTSPTLLESVEITGEIRAVLNVRTTAANTDFTVKLVDVHPDGAAYNVCDGILRRSYVGAASPTEITIGLWPTSMVFLRGHRIRIEVSSSNFPRFDRNPNTGRFIPTETQRTIAQQRVYRSENTASRIELPVVPIDGRTTFEFDAQ
ncbi:MAG TPA: CocE/NonD family hydrolase [Candidatus Hydrogenedentes bacterium]|nr:CocE/NonD family hydrolase [Candidatus Hydrogenedentota bacterium]